MELKLSSHDQLYACSIAILDAMTKGVGDSEVVLVTLSHVITNHSTPFVSF